MKLTYKRILTWLFIKSIAPKVKPRFSEIIFCFEFPTNTLYYNFEPIERSFGRQMVKWHHHRPRVNLYVYSLLHELGHYFNDEEFEYEYDEDIAVRDFCSKFSMEKFEQSEHLQSLYYKLPSEFEATQWAIKYFNKHKLKCFLFNIFLPL